MPILDRTLAQPGYLPAQHWRGRSGHLYVFETETLAGFMLSRDRLSVIASAGIVLWVGSATEVIEDAVSRARFRLAMSRATQAFSLEAPTDPVERMTMLWDVETAEPAGDSVAA